ncbi:NfeD family protein [Pseudomonas sp. NCCP-436]|uniref:NfeD family protein n=1 Tax=Pseudomonas sp. NCCP-436 TaxID=2842481 RepID=UPI001C7F2FAF|nr:NfeD family protein [Pseudomonas sp. NCCP-436]GIZ12447.1 hypothetical protein NCCP436_18630 [Pseudomonas sp. NCCP-436]
MIAYLNHLSFWHWLALATLLLVFEVFGAAGYLLWISLIAVAVGLLSMLLPDLAWFWQLLLFVTLATLSSLLWRHLQRRANRNRH